MTRPSDPARVRVTTLAVIRSKTTAACQDCAWKRAGSGIGGWPATREASRRHADQTGHAVMASFLTSYVYGVTATKAEAEPSAEAAHVWHGDHGMATGGNVRPPCNHWPGQPRCEVCGMGMPV